MAGVRRIYGATGLTGTGVGALSRIISTDLKFGDLAIAQADTVGGPDHGSEFDAIYFYRFADVTTIQSSPTVIKPNNLTDGQSGRWLLISPAWFMEDLTVEVGSKVVTNEIIGNTLDLSLGYNDGSIYITIGDNLVTIDAPTTFTSQITSTVSDGTAPFYIPDTTTVSENLNAFYIGNLAGDKATYEEVAITDGTHLFTGVPGVVNTAGVPDITPSQPYHFVTIQALDDILDTPLEISHNDLGNLVWADEPTNTIIADDHLQYPRVDGTRGFTGEVAGIDPTVLTSLATAQYVQDEIQAKATDVHIRKDGTIQFTSVSDMPSVVNAVTQVPYLDEHLTTKLYVDTATDLDHSDLNNLTSGDDHTQYILVTGTRPFSGAVGGVTPTQDAHLATKLYVDTVATSITDAYVRRDGTIAFSGQPSVTVSPTDPLGIILTPGSGYTNDTAVPTSGGSGTGLTVNTTTDGNQVLSVTVSNSGNDYTIGDVVNILGTSGDGLATFTVTDGSPTFTPADPWEIATVEYVDALVGGGNHDSLIGVNTSTAHEAFPLLTGARPFTGVISGVTPTIDAHLATKGYVDTTLITSHSALADLVIPDDHTQYIHVDGRRVFDTTSNFPAVSNNGTTPDAAPTQLFELTTKDYVDGKLTDLGNLELFNYVDVWGNHPIVSNQTYVVQHLQHPFKDASLDELANIDYITNYTSKFVVSFDDEHFDFFDAKIETDNTATIDKTLNDGTLTGIKVETTTTSLEGIDRIQITNGGTGFFVFDPESKVTTYPHTFLDATNSGIFDSTGTSGTDLTETVMYPNSDLGTDADILVLQVVGDVEYMEIVNDGGNTLTALKDNWYTFIVAGDGYQKATWEAFVTNAGPEVADDPITDGYISAVRRDTTADNLGVGAGYSSTRTYPMNSIIGILGTFSLQPYVTGAVTNFEVVTAGTGYTSASYNLIDGNEGFFTLSGEGTSGGLITGNTLNLTFENPLNEKLKFSLYASDSQWEIKSGTAFELEYGKSYFVDVNTSNITVTLPDEDLGGVGVNAPQLGNTFTIDDYKNGTESITPRYIRVQPHATQGGNLLVEGSTTTPMDIDVAGSRVIFTYVDATYGWRYKVI